MRPIATSLDRPGTVGLPELERQVVDVVALRVRDLLHLDLTEVHREVELAPDQAEYAEPVLGLRAGRNGLDEFHVRLRVVALKDALHSALVAANLVHDAHRRALPDRHEGRAVLTDRQLDGVLPEDFDLDAFGLIDDPDALRPGQ